jgi:hypothetical protein
MLAAHNATKALRPRRRTTAVDAVEGSPKADSGIRSGPFTDLSCRGHRVPNRRVALAATGGTPASEPRHDYVLIGGLTATVVAGWCASGARRSQQLQHPLGTTEHASSRQMRMFRLLHARQLVETCRPQAGASVAVATRASTSAMIPSTDAYRCSAS